MGIAEQFSPGELVRARGREWVVVDSSNALTLRPLSGSEADLETIIPELEADPVTYASFEPPSLTDKVGGRDAAQLLRDALRLSLRRGAGPFRAAGRINFEPRAYQLAPLMMALRQDVIRLLIADDVGIGKTIEAGLILREMLDRGEIDRFTVLCPPHLVEQWTGELESKFSIPATPVTASEAARLERNLPNTVSIFEAYPFTVVSMDFIKSERRFFDFKRACPNMVVVDEAHSAVSAGKGRQRRYELVRSLADDPERNILLLTATPHSGDETAFHNLLGLLDKEFAGLQDAGGERQRQLRERLAGHFIQRRRRDIDAWKEPGLFPTHETSNFPYRLTGEYEEFYGKILDYCAEVIESVEGETKKRLAFWGTLALMRCVGSSPAAAARALKTRAQLDPSAVSESELSAQTLDDEELSENDFEPGVGIEDQNLASLIDTADKLSSEVEKDPKFKALIKALEDMLKKGHSPVIFCRYIATAEQIGAALQKFASKHVVEVVTGSMPSEEREIRVEELGSHEKRILVATDCLSEGINLQAWFDAVIHYDLSWNPTRHQQREGRIDRFGQKAPTVRSVLMYGENNPVDGAVLEVIIRKAEAIAKQTGVRVPMPDDQGSLTQALMSTVMLRARGEKQMALELDFSESEEARQIEIAWINASEQEKKTRTIFAQNSLKPEEVAVEWEATQTALGGYEDTERFVFQAMKRLGQPLESLKSGAYKVALHLVPDHIKERFIAESLIEDADIKPLKVGFSARPPTGTISIHRAHALPSVLAETFLEQALDEFADEHALSTLPRLGAWETDAVEEVTWVALLRVRHCIDSRGKLGPKFAMAEESAAIAFSASSKLPVKWNEDAFALLDQDGQNLDNSTRQNQIDRALNSLEALQPALTHFAHERSEALAGDHVRVRQALGSKGQVKVSAITPVDVIGFYVLMPGL
ncbi:DEAD/DEAH box helicase [Planktomarina temperata]|nr:DEAD/DEAH box helicase [Planktomarina temperata]